MGNTSFPMGNVVIASPNEAKIISGCRGTKVIVGACGCALWCCETSHTLSLEIMTLEVKSVSAETAHGVPVSVTAVSQIKVMANRFRERTAQDQGPGTMQILREKHGEGGQDGRQRGRRVRPGRDGRSGH